MTSPRRRAVPLSEVARFLRTETVGGMILLVAAAVALVWVNSPWGDSYADLRDLAVGPSALHLDLSLGAWATDGLLALFFFVVGLELKRELVLGELSDRRAAMLPVLAAVGGIVVPALIALAVTGAEGKIWSIPVATDIAFALAVLAIMGRGLPSSARIFLLSLAVVDDLGAITLIAVLFTDEFKVLAFAAAVVLCAVYWVLQRRRVRSSLVYVPIAALTWFAVHETGLHATVAGVVLALLTRETPDEGEAESPALRLEHRLQPWSAGVAVPVFALFAAGIPINLDALQAVAADRVAYAIVFGLLIGKVVGILGFAAAAVRLRVATLPSGLGWRDMIAVSLLCGVGFTVSLLMTELALSGEAAERAKAAVLIASALAVLLASVKLTRRRKAHRLLEVEGEEKPGPVR